MNTRAILIGYQREKDLEFSASMKEMEALCEAAMISVETVMVQKGRGPLHASYFGKGKLEELKQKLEEERLTVIVVNDDLNAAQIKQIEEITDVGVLDRTSLILRIFTDRAKSREARLQVMIAQLQYELPRLLGSYDNLGRQGGVGGAHNKGAGEKKIALDKRKIERQIISLKKELKKVESNRLTQRQARQDSLLKRVALVGYTNAGKSTLMNAFLKQMKEEHKKQVFEKDMLFATLDTSTRLIDVQGYYPFLLSDTVGFVSRLPHLLVEAFQSTLSEVKEADLLIHVLDISDKEVQNRIQITEKTLHQIGAEHIPVLRVYSKVDLVNEEDYEGSGIAVSGITLQGIDLLLRTIEERLYGPRKKQQLLIPYHEGAMLTMLKKNAENVSWQKTEAGILCQVCGVEELLQQVRNAHID